MIMPKPKTERRTRRGRPRLATERKDLIVKFYNEDMPIRKIAKTCAVSTSTIYRVLRERSVKK